MPKWLRVGASILALALVLGILAFGLLRLLGPQQRFATFSLPYVEDFSGEVDIKRWFVQDGNWTVRNEALVQTANLDKPANIFVPQKLPAGQAYHLSVYISLVKNTQAAGVNFNSQYPKLTEKTQRAALIRGGEGQLTLEAGYTDEKGAWVRQVAVPFEADAQEYRLDLYVYATTYEVQINGQALINGHPLFYHDGLVGFYSLGPTRFDTLKITAAESGRRDQQVYVSDFDQPNGGGGWVPFRGEWKLSQNELTQIDPSIDDAGIGYEGGAFENFMLQTTFHHLTGTGGGILFNLLSPYQTSGGHLVSFSDQADALFWGYYDEQGAFTRQGFAVVDAVGSEPHQIRVYSGDTSYDIFLDDQLMARAVPLQRSTGYVGLATTRSSVAYSLVEIFPLLGGTPVSQVKQLATVAPADTPASVPTLQTRRSEAATATRTTAGEAVAGKSVRTSTPARSPAPAGQTVVVGGTGSLADFGGDIQTSAWRPIGGAWRFADGALLQSDTAGFDLSIAYTANPFRNYTLDASMAHRSGTGGGVLFNMPFTDRLNGAHMVRYSERRPGGIFWGYFDAAGRFVGQGYANVEPPADGRHALRVVSGDTTYSIYLDGRPLGENVPLQSTQGYVGLITVQSSVAYDSVEVSDAQISPSATRSATAAGQATATPRVYGSAQGFPDQRVVTGNWETTAGVYRQTVPDSGDYILSTGINASAFTMESEIVLPEKPEVGAGLLFCMPDVGRKNGACLARLTLGGRGVMWGVYDEAGAFRGRGSADLAPIEGGVYRLTLDVRDGRMNLSIDGKQVASDVALPRADGWIGLLSFGGPVTFQDVTITVDAAQ
jgi:hypothetical protein